MNSFEIVSILQSVTANTYSISSVWLWLLLALLFLCAELALPGLFFCLSFVVGSVFSAVCAALDCSLQAQYAIWLASSAVVFVILRKIYAGSMKIESSKTNVDALIGHCALVTQRITLTQCGRVKFRGEEWPARMRHGFVAEIGATVRIVGIEGNHVIITVMPDDGITN